MPDNPYVPLRPIDWDADEVTTAIGEIVADALAGFDPVDFWPAHPSDDGLPDGTAGGRPARQAAMRPPSRARAARWPAVSPNCRSIMVMRLKWWPTAYSMVTPMPPCS